ncbi:MAG: hypothetical protein A2Y77_01505, partial [Planctomycetes bacterium RBG_13_62_9]
IVIVTWNVRSQLMDCLQSIGRCPPCGAFDVIVIDNASTDGTVDAVRRDFPRVNLIANKENRGFAAASNQGIAESHSECLLLLNPDTIVHPQSLDTLCAFLDSHPDVGACGPRLLNDDGTTQASTRRFPTFRATLHHHTIFRHLHIFRRQYKSGSMQDFLHDEQRDVDQLMGSALLLRRSAVDQVGPMDERFFMYYEEVDLCYRLKQAGWRIVFVPDAVITHLGGRSSSQAPVAARIMMLSSLLRYFRKHRGPVATGLFNCLFKPAVIAREVCDILVGGVTYAASLMVCNGTRCTKSAAKVRNSAILLGKHSWWLLFKA